MVGLDQYDAEPLEQQQFETAGVERVKFLPYLHSVDFSLHAAAVAVCFKLVAVNEWMNEWMNELITECLRQLKSSLSKAFSRGRARRKKMKSVRSAGEAWSDTDTDEVLTAAELVTSPAGPGALSMPNSPSLNAARPRPALYSPTTPSPTHRTALHNAPVAKWVNFNPFRPSDGKWLHFRVFSAMLV